MGDALFRFLDWLEDPATSGLVRAGVFAVGMVVLAAAMVLLGKLVGAYAARSASGKFAAARGWTYEGFRQYSGQAEWFAWRARPQSDSEEGQAWTEFEANFKQGPRGQFAIFSRETASGTAAPREALSSRRTERVADGDRRAADERGIRERATGDSAFDRAFVLLANDDSWRAVARAAAESGWLKALDGAPERRSVCYRDGRMVVRMEGVQLESAQAIEPFIALSLGVAHAVSTAALPWDQTRLPGNVP